MMHSPGRSARGDGVWGGRMGIAAIAAVLLAVLTPAVSATALTVTIDYRFDRGGFFDAGNERGRAARARLEEAATLFTDLVVDPLAAIAPGTTTHGLTDRWTTFFADPSSGGRASAANLNLGRGEVIVFAGARDLGGNVLGTAFTGAAFATGSAAFVESVQTRGQTGVGTTDVAPWGGSIAFDEVGTNWYFGESAAVPFGRTDFRSVALHEIAHILGVGSSGSWFDQLAAAPGCASGLAFYGEAAMAVHGSPVCLDGSADHWEEGTQSDGREAALDPLLDRRTRKELTELDLAGLRDVGWELSVPEPAGLALAALLALGLKIRRKRC